MALISLDMIKQIRSVADAYEKSEAARLTHVKERAEARRSAASGSDGASRSQANRAR